jgi:threonine/homoserine/homoserine lactone efflux protein
LTESFVAGVLAGLAIAIPVGAIAVLIIDTGIRFGFRPAAAAGAGVASADGIYAMVASLFGAAIAGVIAPWVVPLRLASVVVLLIVATRLVVAALAARRVEAAAVAVAPAVRTTYLRFLGLTLINPATVIYFTALIVGLSDTGAGPAERLAFVAGAFLASLGWQLSLARFAAVAHHRLPPSARVLTSVVGSVVIVLFAARIAFGG